MLLLNYFVKMFKMGLTLYKICHTIHTMDEIKYQRKVLSVSFRNEEWNYILEHLPDFTNFSKFARELILKEVNYPTENKSKSK